MIAIIVACDANNLIGKKDSDNGMPWHNSEDFKHFKNATINHTILMGKTTYLAIGRPLPKRHNIVLSHNLQDERVEVVEDLKKTIDAYKEKNEDLFITGGASVYKQALPYCDTILLSRIPGEYTGETYFPDFSEYNYRLIEEKPFETFTLEIYKK